jgi:hypothetical protein
MKAVLLAALGVLAGCRNEHQSEPPPPSSPRVSDSVSITAIEDSLIDGAVIGGPAVITPTGDTLSNFGGSMMEGDVARDYGIDHYTKNGTWYVRIQQMTSRRPNGKPVWATRARLRLPPETSRDNLATAGLCSVEGKNDPFVIGVTGATVDSVSFQATHAWRFNLAQQTLNEIPAASVTCAYPSGDD